VVLDDPKHAIPPYDAVLLIAPKRADDAAFIDALRPLLDAINVATMRDANARASAEGASPDQVARWLWEKISQR
jgi:osmoprotectant transport system permease protein